MMLSAISWKKKFFLLILTSGLIIFLIITIFLINKSNNSQLKVPQQHSQTTSELISLLSKIEQSVITEDSKSPEYLSAISYLNSAKNSNSQKNKYEAVKNAANRLQLLYTLTNHSYLYNLINTDLVSFVKTNFPEYYNESEFIYPCQDASCAEDPQPKEILSIIEDIKNSDLPKEYKDIYSRSLTNTGYISPKNRNEKVFLYLNTAKSLTNSSDISPSGVNLKIAQRIREFVKSAYPSEFEIFTKVQESVSQK